MASVLAILFVTGAAIGCAPESDGSSTGSGGASASGGAQGMGTGGKVGSGGNPPSATGGSSGTGGVSTGTGGSLSATGGSSNGSGGIPGGSGGNSPGTGGGNNIAGTNGSTGGASGGSGGTGGTVSGSGGTSSGGAGGSVVAACASNQISKCTGTNPVTCHFGGSPGNFEVTVDLGGSAAGETYVEVESYRRMLGQTSTAAGATKRFSFIVNVREYEGEPRRPDQDSSYPKGTAGLDVYFRGPSPKVTAICQQAIAKPQMIWIAGDSTVCDQAGTDYAGWGQHLPQHFLSPVSIANYADSGESSGTFLAAAKLWPTVKAAMGAGDWVLIQFGHNDKEVSASSFQSNLTKMLDDVNAAGAKAVLFTPISRVGYTLAEEHVNSVGANLPQIIRDLGKNKGVPVVDLTVTTWNWIQGIDWTDYFALGTDKTHTNVKGAEVVAGFVRDALRTQVPDLAKYLRN